MKKMGIAFLLISLGVTARIWLVNFLPPAPRVYVNLAGTSQPILMPADVFFVIGAISLIAGRYLGKYFSFIVPISTMAITDLILGNNFLLLFTWSGFIAMGLMGNAFRKTSYIGFMGVGILSVLLYDLWTNFGWWLGGYYGLTFNGLILCYTLAIPFMLWHLISMAITLPLFAVPFENLSKSSAPVINFI